MGAKGSGSQEALGSSKPRRLSSSQSASRHRPGVRSDDRLTPPCEVTERCTRKEHVEPRRSTSLESRDIHRGGNATRRPRTFAARIRKERSSGRDHGERHFGARNPLLRGSADLRTLLARRPLLHAGLHLHDRERRGREVSAVFANEITTRSVFTDARVGIRWLSWRCPTGHPARACWRTTQLARGKSSGSPDCRLSEGNAKRPHEDANQRGALHGVQRW
jgi:hypothetical protein